MMEQWVNQEEKNEEWNNGMIGKNKAGILEG